MILVVASMEIELEGLFGLDRSPAHWEDCKLSYTGIGKKNVKQTFDNLEDSSNLDGLLSVGFVGSVDPGVKPGEICLIESVGTPGQKGRFYPDKPFWTTAQQALGGDYKSCELLTVDNTVSNSGEKRSFRIEGFSLIDRETYWVAKMADGEKIPFLSMRVVIDGVDQDLPPEVCYDSETGKVKPGEFVSWLARNPSRVGELPRLGWNSVKARHRLSEATNRVVSALLE
ncbi:MAG: hypothetical protein ABEJ25_07260 [Candidatus Bipolaricaulia bacterium]